MSEVKKISHVDSKGKVTMVNVVEKKITHRKAVAQARVFLPVNVLEKLSTQNFQVAKGSVTQTAIIAGIMAAKKTSELIPLCHPIGIDGVNIEIDQSGEELCIKAIVSVEGKTGVEMEALTAVSVAALTIYDMCKALSHEIVISEIKLLEKSGGKNDFKREA